MEVSDETRRMDDLLLERLATGEITMRSTRRCSPT
jgi:hypothetical protein